jgi:hypothetical protein
VLGIGHPLILPVDLGLGTQEAGASHLDTLRGGGAASTAAPGAGGTLGTAQEDVVAAQAATA